MTKTQRRSPQWDESEPGAMAPSVLTNTDQQGMARALPYDKLAMRPYKYCRYSLFWFVPEF